MIYFDGVILAHSNEAEWNRFKSDHTNEAILDRIVKVDVPYCLELNEEIKIYEKILRRSNFKSHIAPHSIEIGAMFAILTRLAPSNKVDPLTKMKIYNGEEIVEKGMTKKVDIMELREEAGIREGMSGISTRFVIKAIDTALTNSEHHCVNPLSVLESLIRAVKDLDIPDDQKKGTWPFCRIPSARNTTRSWKRKSPRPLSTATRSRLKPCSIITWIMQRPLSIRPSSRTGPPGNSWTRTSRSCVPLKSISGFRKIQRAASGRM